MGRAGIAAALPVPPARATARQCAGWRARRGAAHQRRNAGGDCSTHAERGWDRLRVEETGDRQEPGEEHRCRGITLVARLEQLQPREEQQHHAGRATEKGAVFQPDAGRAERHDGDQRPTRWQQASIPESCAAPAVEEHGEENQPPGRVQRVRRGHDQQAGEQQREFAPADRALLGEGGQCGKCRQSGQCGPCGRDGLDLAHVARYKASASRQAARCASPRPGLIWMPGRRSP